MKIFENLKKSLTTSNMSQYAILFNNTSNKKTSSKQIGRSMIEMLGVLALIAVLSVGGIAGYSKAMEKYKLNKAISEYNNLIFGVIEHIDDFRTPGTNYGYTLQQLGLIPKSWKISSWYIDSFGNWVSIHSLPQQTNIRFDIWLSGVNYADEYRFSQGFSHKFCISFIEQLVYPLHESLKNFSFLRTIGSNNGSSVSFAGDAFCSQNKKCIKKLTINDINSLCKTCDNTKQACAIVLDF